MPNLIRPGSTKVITRNGEVELYVVLDLNVNLNTDGLQLSTTAAKARQEQEEEDEDDDKVNWAIPEFASGKDKVKFGKNIEE